MTTQPSLSPTISQNAFLDFSNVIQKYYQDNKRILPWRENISPYGVLVSEIMLQQTQVPRVLVKYDEWMSQFPDFKTLADAPLQTVLTTWQGMGYNRRALYLKKIAETLMLNHQGTLPSTYEELIKLPGIGKNTAGSILAFTYNVPVIFIETNIRRIFIHHFFSDQAKIDDKDLIPLIEQTIDNNNPREWYYALMDYGTYLAKKVENPNRKSRHYTKQSPLKGSVREARGRILKQLTQEKMIKKTLLEEKIDVEHARFEKAFQQLLTEGFIQNKEGLIKIKQ